MEEIHSLVGLVPGVIPNRILKNQFFFFRLFYDSQLIPSGDRMLTHSCRDWEELPKKGFPVLFHSVTGKDTREGKNPSFFNPEEAVIVVDYVDKLLANKQKVKQKSSSNIHCSFCIHFRIKITFYYTCMNTDC